MSDTASQIEHRLIAGTGIGLRAAHVDEILTTLPDVPWFELLADNHMVNGGLIKAQLEAICEHYPVTLHSVGLSLGSVDALNLPYLRRLKQMAQQYPVAWLSEHLCFTSCDGVYVHDLLPIPYTEESLSHVVERIRQVQDILGQRILIENVSSYLQYAVSDIEEVEFISAVSEQADCNLLIDVNNIYVNHINLGTDPVDYINALPLERIKEVHLAGYEQKEKYLLDAHNNKVSREVWELYTLLMARRSSIPTLIEWDNDIPAFSVLRSEARKAERIRQLSGTQDENAA